MVHRQINYAPSTPISQELWLRVLGERAAEFLGIVDTMEAEQNPILGSVGLASEGMPSSSA